MMDDLFPTKFAFWKKHGLETGSETHSDIKYLRDGAAIENLSAKWDNKQTQWCNVLNLILGE